MPFTEQQLKQQEEQLAALKDELSRLNSVYDSLVKEEGVSAVSNEDMNNLPPEMKQVLEEAQEKAKRAGAARVAQAQLHDSSSSNSKPLTSNRRNAVRL